MMSWLACRGVQESRWPLPYHHLDLQGSEGAVGKQSAQDLVATISAGQLQNVTLDV
jgi:hypothetical protein